jgi:hypothetical protein
MKKIILLSILVFNLSAFAQQKFDILKNAIGVYVSINNEIMNDAKSTSDLMMCDRCEERNCISVKNWWGTGSFDKETFYTKVTNNTNSTITYKLCVLKKNGYWSCGTDQVRAFSASSTLSYSNVAGESKYWAAYGEWKTQECKFPDPNK